MSSEFLDLLPQGTRRIKENIRHLIFDRANYYDPSLVPKGLTCLPQLAVLSFRTFSYYIPSFLLRGREGQNIQAFMPLVRTVLLKGGPGDLYLLRFLLNAIPSLQRLGFGENWYTHSEVISKLTLEPTMWTNLQELYGACTDSATFLQRLGI